MLCRVFVSQATRWSSNQWVRYNRSAEAWDGLSQSDEGRKYQRAIQTIPTHRVGNVDSALGFAFLLDVDNIHKHPRLSHSNNTLDEAGKKRYEFSKPNGRTAVIFPIEMKEILRNVVFQVHLWLPTCWSKPGSWHDPRNTGGRFVSCFPVPSGATGSIYCHKSFGQGHSVISDVNCDRVWKVEIWYLEPRRGGGCLKEIWIGSEIHKFHDLADNFQWR